MPCDHCSCTPSSLAAHTSPEKKDERGHHSQATPCSETASDSEALGNPQMSVYIGRRGAQSLISIKILIRIIISLCVLSKHVIMHVYS